MEESYAVRLSQLLTKSTVRAKVPVRNWEEAIRTGGGLLEQSGAVSKAYVEGMVKNMQTLGPYIVLAPGIAMPHARPELGVYRLGVSLITLANPINFGNPDNDPVSLVFCLAAPDDKTHLEMMSDWVHLMAAADRIAAILDADNTEEILSVIIDTGVSELSKEVIL